MKRLLSLVVVLLVILAAPASAHTVMAGSDMRFAQSIGGSELTVVIKATKRVPGTLAISAERYDGPGVPLALELRSAEDGSTVRGDLSVGGTARLRVTRAGPYELTLRAGDEISVVPFRVLVARGAAWELLIYGGLFVAAVLLVGGLLTGRLGRGLTFAAALAVGMAATLVVAEPYLPQPQPDGAAPTADGLGRPYVQARVTTTPPQPIAGRDFTLRLQLVDGSTGRPVDDLVVHHEALAHVVVTSQDARYFRHVHPRRVAPGLLEVRLRADIAGRMLVWAELERVDSGGQLVPATFEVSGREVSGQTPTPATNLTAVAGRPTTIKLEEQTRPWLGMPGHLIVRDAAGSFLGHVHATGRQFTFTFPEPGRYHAWVQYATSEDIVTRPYLVNVS
ncbi:hypothetical protein ACFXJ8_29180 [Nonomuraea sp. NPDC059194]|uniref:hypothetical protein n=1 Tax=Nonomuraea sp. NPDC059194 TaxID=3346764 RepID=UPI0036984912